MNQPIESVKQYTIRKSGKFSAKGLAAISFFTFLGALVSVLVTFGLIMLIHFDIILVTMFAIWILTAGGASFGNSKGACRNGLMFCLALLPAAILLGIVALINALPIIHGVSKNAIWSIVESIGIAATPILVYFITFKDQNYCETCNLLFKSAPLLSSTTASPTDIRTRLLTRRPLTVPNTQSHGGSSYHDQATGKVDVIADHCPRCFQAVVNATLRYTPSKAKEEKQILFYSDYWASDSFRQTYPEFVSKQEATKQTSVPTS